MSKANEANLECVAEYEHNGKKWALDFYAESPEDAAAKIESIKASAVLLGVQSESKI
ncbi:MAG: hypothetical protein NTW90_07065 [Nitrosospira sp.]|nr:hypothetical protein [Nitrosospira sp.]